MERRKNTRYKVDIDVVINGLISAEGLDLSSDGMYVYVSHSFLPNSIVDLTFDLGTEKVSIPAKVLHSQPGIGFGVNFFDFPEVPRGKIREYVIGTIGELEGIL